MKSAGLLIAVGLIGCKARETSAPREPTRAPVAAADVDAIADNGPMGDARIVPAFRDGAIIGFRLLDVREGTATAKLGLRKGDVLTGYNGQSLHSPDTALDFYNALSGTGPITLDILRDDKPAKLERAQ